MEPNTFLNLEQPPDPPASGSKRKRTHALPINGQDRHIQDHQQENEDGHTPKRARSTRYNSEDRVQTNTSPARNVRRKKGRYSLSSLSRGYENAIRPSKFQEGSMNDKPSDKPPSLYIRPTSGNDIRNPEASLDDLMGDYHAGADGMRESIEHPTPPYRFGTHTAHEFRASPAMTKAAEGKESGIHRLSRFFNPVNVWESFSRTWKETRDEMTIHNIEENRKKAAQKLLAEQKYAEFKQNGAFGHTFLNAVREDVAGSASPSDGQDPPVSRMARDSAVIMNDERSLIEAQKTSLAATPVVRPLQNVDANQSLAPFQEESSEKPLKSRKSLFHIRRPSLTNLKRVRSEHSLAGLGRHSSLSLSPEKRASADVGTLRPSQSRKDLHKQQKLSKRVSDLENKLQEARRELTAAISNASPLPSLPSRFERYTPNNASNRSTFIPGALPSLPSERLLFPEQAQAHLNDESAPTTNERSATSKTSALNIIELDPEDAHALIEDSPSRPGSRSNQEPTQAQAPIAAEHLDNLDHTIDMDPSTFMTSEAPATQQEGYADLDSKLKALDTSIKSRTTRKAGRPRKRKSDDKPFVPAKGSDSDDDLEGGASKKKRKSAPKEKSATTKKTLRKSTQAASVSKTALVVEHSVAQTVSEEIEVAMPRRSMESQLEPISEEDTVAVSNANKANNNLAPPTQSRTRSRSPGKFGQLKCSHQAVAGARDHARSPSPPPAIGNSKPNEIVDGAVTASPGIGDVPPMPDSALASNSRAAKARMNTATDDEPFEWPEDVF